MDIKHWLCDSHCTRSNIYSTKQTDFCVRIWEDPGGGQKSWLTGHSGAEHAGRWTAGQRLRELCKHQCREQRNILIEWITREAAGKTVIQEENYPWEDPENVRDARNSTRKVKWPVILSERCQTLFHLYKTSDCFLRSTGDPWKSLSREKVRFLLHFKSLSLKYWRGLWKAPVKRLATATCLIVA